MDIQQALRELTEGRDLSPEAMTAVMRQIMTGGATPAQIGGFLVALRMKGETVDEIAAAAAVMRELADKVPVDPAGLVDPVGTGGDHSGIFNVSTAAAFIAAAAGARVAKHGNRSVSSRSGAADVLEAAGVRIDLDPRGVARCIEEIGIGFMFAPMHHGAMKHAVGPRREMGVRTVFNLLGPLTNPAGAPHQLLGVFSADWLEALVRVLAKLGSRHVLAVHAEDGLDEISHAAATDVVELRDGEIRRYRIQPEDFGIARGRLEDIRVADAAESLAMLRSVLDDTPGPARDIAVLNAAATLYAADRVPDLAAGVEAARAALASGAARRKLEALVEVSNRVAGS